MAMGMDATSEFTVLDSMLEQASRIRGDSVETLLLDANYHRLPIVETALEHGVDLLCPPKDKTPQWRSKTADKPAKFTKHDFKYLPDEDVLVCPADKHLNPGSTQSDAGLERSYRVFYSNDANCRECPPIQTVWPNGGPARICALRNDTQPAAMEEAGRPRRFQRSTRPTIYSSHSLAAIPTTLAEDLGETSGVSNTRTSDGLSQPPR